jgi:hypothetical protein
MQRRRWRSGASCHRTPDTTARAAASRHLCGRGAAAAGLAEAALLLLLLLLLLLRRRRCMRCAGSQAVNARGSNVQLRHQGIEPQDRCAA